MAVTIAPEAAGPSHQELHEAIFAPSEGVSRLTPVAEHFLRGNLDITERYPQTQTVIGMHTAKFIVDSILRDETEALIKFFDSLRTNDVNECVINLDAVSIYVRDMYDKIGFTTPEIPPIKFLQTFRYELGVGINLITNHLALDKDGTCNALHPALKRTKPVENGREFPSYTETLNLLSRFPRSRLEELSSGYQSCLEAIDDSRRIRQAKRSLFRELRKKGRSKDWDVIAEISRYRQRMSIEALDIVRNHLVPALGGPKEL